jgi:hypothetical protein
MPDKYVLPPEWEWPITIALFVAGVASGAGEIEIIHFAGDKRDQPVPGARVHPASVDARRAVHRRPRPARVIPQPAVHEPGRGRATGPARVQLELPDELGLVGDGHLRPFRGRRVRGCPSPQRAGALRVARADLAQRCRPRDRRDPGARRLRLQRRAPQRHEPGRLVGHLAHGRALHLLQRAGWPSRSW